LTSNLRLLALDIGAESGRGVVGAFDGDVLTIEEVARFANVPVTSGETLTWDFPRLLADVRGTIASARSTHDLASVGIDTWGVDFGLLDGAGHLLANPVHHRDRRTEGVVERAAARVSREETYAATGIQVLPINTLYQLCAMVEARDPSLERAARMLLMPDLLNHALCGSRVCEYTNATTTACYDTSRREWASDLLARLDIPMRLMPEVVPPGTRLGEVDGVQVIAPGTHDTASAVAATPLDADGGTAYLSSGTWSLLGMEVDAPVITSASRAANLTNEGGVGGKTRLLKNVMGLWLIQQARSALGGDISYAELTALAEAARPGTAVLDPDDERFLRPTDIRATVGALCQETAQPVPEDAGTLVRVLLESLAAKYAHVVREIEAVTGRAISAIDVVGGGSNNDLLNRLTARATGKPVRAGPSEATAIGNLLVQAIALGELRDLAEARALVARSFPARRYA
jgi:rhamnulokinase